MSSAVAAPSLTVALIGNPNCGKSTLFNRLTGLRQRVANYAGVTVERRLGRMRLTDGVSATVVDLPGVRSLAPRSPDERIAVDVLLGRRSDVPPPDVALVVLNAHHLEVGLYLLLQVRELGLPAVAAVNMADETERVGLAIDYEKLSRELGVPAVRTVATEGAGLDALKEAIAGVRETERRPPEPMPAPLREACARLRTTWNGAFSDTELADYLVEGREAEGASVELGECLEAERRRLAQTGADVRELVVGTRFRRASEICSRAVAPASRDRRGTWTRRLDGIVTHPIAGYAVFLFLMALIFQAMFRWAEWPMGWIEGGIAAAGNVAADALGPGDLSSLLRDGVLAGVGAVVVFLPQIVLLFLFMGILEDTGYMSRAVLLLDRPLSAVGLSGRGFVPLLGSMACAVPGVMATRVIPDARERLATICVAPLMTCSARLPVYTCLIGAVLVERTVAGVASLRGVTLLGLYLLGVLSALTAALVLRRTTLRRTSTNFVVELPPYRWPTWRTTGVQLWHRVKTFLVRAGTVILGISILLWFLTQYPKSGGSDPAVQLEQSLAGRAGKAIEPVIRPLGYDWKVGIGLLTSFFSAREVFVSTMSTVYSVEEEGDGVQSLQRRLREERDEATGAPRWTLPVGLSLLVFYAYAMLCSSTVVTVFRETGSWKWALGQVAAMTALAYGAAFVTYRIAFALAS
ncbi:MAG: ferrous iron transport protein B [Planctomycetes bacterium]|nr:ferrous iron transport protein B [Planctomycetota bacterium]